MVQYVNQDRVGLVRSENRNEKDQDQRVRFIIFNADTELQTTFLMFNLILGQWVDLAKVCNLANEGSQFLQSFYLCKTYNMPNTSRKITLFCQGSSRPPRSNYWRLPGVQEDEWEGDGDHPVGAGAGDGGGDGDGGSFGDFLLLLSGNTANLLNYKISKMVISPL